ncbi:unnamed protein product [Meloidogyne enterolobii]|uniref:Uncharacterized protein n=1 Tax=Meloidogyne enterolobii TaxID=390850 RepID=A0ACB0Z5X0_MELEN
MENSNSSSSLFVLLFSSSSIPANPNEKKGVVMTGVTIVFLILSFSIFSNDFGSGSFLSFVILVGVGVVMTFSPFV